MTSILVETATAIAEALTVNAFDYGDFVADWDWESRLQDASLVAEQLDVRVIIPRMVDSAVRDDQNSLRYVMAFDIDVRLKFGTISQGADSPLVAKNTLTPLQQLIEDIHEFFFDSPELDSGNIKWVDEENLPRGGTVISRILVAYSPKFLREKRMFYGVCREYFSVCRELGVED